MIASRPWLGITKPEWLIKSDTPQLAAHIPPRKSRMPSSMVWPARLVPTASTAVMEASRPGRTIHQREMVHDAPTP